MAEVKITTHQINKVNKRITLVRHENHRYAALLDGDSYFNAVDVFALMALPYRPVRAARL